MDKEQILNNLYPELRIAQERVQKLTEEIIRVSFEGTEEES